MKITNSYIPSPLETPVPHKRHRVSRGTWITITVKPKFNLGDQNVIYSRQNETSHLSERRHFCDIKNSALRVSLVITHGKGVICKKKKIFDAFFLYLDVILIILSNISNITL